MERWLQPLSMHMCEALNIGNFITKSFIANEDRRHIRIAYFYLNYWVASRFKSYP